jgi:hypothetical protein
MITEHTDTTTTTPHKEVRQRYLGDQSRTRHHNPPDTPPDPCEKEEAVRIIAAPVLKMLASTIQFSNNNPHTLHTGGNTPYEGDTTTGRTPGTQTQHPHPHQRGRGLLSQDPIVRHGPHPPPDRFSSTTHTIGTPQGPPRWDRY